MSNLLEEAIEYCKPFAINQGEAILRYGHIKEDRLIAGDCRNCIECRFFNLHDDKGERLIPLVKEVATSSADVGECTKLSRDLILRNVNQYEGSFAMRSKRGGLRKTFEYWRNAFRFCKENFGKAGIPHCILEMNHNGFYIYSIGEKNVNIKIELCTYQDMKPLRIGSLHYTFDLERLIHICDVLAKTNPTSVIFYTDSPRERILIETDDVRCQISALKTTDSSGTKDFYEQERQVW